MTMERYPALVLNADYTPLSYFPLSLWDMGRTLRNYLKDRITVVEEYGVTLRSPNFSYSPPSVVALKRYVKQPRVVAFTRFNVFLRDEFTCQYCATEFPTHDLTFDHVIPRSRGGRTDFENIVASCYDCNSKKANRSDMRPIRAPFTPTQYDLARVKSRLPANYLHESWLDYLYWDTSIERS